MTVLVAGGTGALGTAVVRELLDAGYDCRLTWIVDRERERIDQELGDRVSLAKTDLTDPNGGVADVVAGVEDLEAVVNLVGGYAQGPLVHETDLPDFMRMIELNLVPAFLLAHEAMPRLVERGERRVRRRVGASRPASVRRRRGLRGRQGGAARLHTGAGCRVRRRGRARERDPPERHRHAREPRGPAECRPRRSGWIRREIAKVVRFLVSEESAPVSGAAVPVYGRA